MIDFLKHYVHLRFQCFPNDQYNSKLPWLRQLIFSLGKLKIINDGLRETTHDVHRFQLFVGILPWTHCTF